MKVVGVISTTALFLLLGATVPAFAQEEHHQEGAKQAQHDEQARPEKQQEQAKPQKQERQAKNQEQNQQHTQQQAKDQQRQHENQHQQQVKTQRNDERGQQHQQQQANSYAQQPPRQYARDGQKDRYGHEYKESRFGRDHHARFEENGGRYYEGRREYSYGGYWFYAGAYPAWFYQRDVYFIMGADGLWYAVAYDNPSLTLQVNIG